MDKVPFIRRLDDAIILKIKNSGESDLFFKLFNDTKKYDKPREAVFPAIRNNKIDFYYSGGSLFSYQHGSYRTHNKYASVIMEKKDKYISEDELKKVRLIENFSEGYERIKENCARFAGVEASGVSELYSRYSYLSADSDIVVLDIEVTLEAESSQNENTAKHKHNRIDFLLFNKKNTSLRFYEAKHFTNREIWAASGKKPVVVNQVHKYERQIKNKKSEILQAYVEYVKIVNKLFGCELPEPTDIDEQVGLLIFGFDRNQFKGRFTDLLLEDSSLSSSNIHLYSIGDISKVKIDALWENTNIPKR